MMNQVQRQSQQSGQNSDSTGAPDMSNMPNPMDLS